MSYPRILSARVFYRSGSLAVLLAISWLLQSCRPTLPVTQVIKKNNTDEAKTPNGDSDADKGYRKKLCSNLVGGELTKSYPYVGLLLAKLKNGFSTCSGTWVSDNTMITASHCVWETPSGDSTFIAGTGDIFSIKSGQDALKQGIKSTQVIIGSPVKTIGKPNSENKLSEGVRDIAILIFPPNTAPAYISVLERKIHADDDLTLVGYGDINTPGASDEFKNQVDARRRKGSNRLSQMDTELRSQFSPDYYIVDGDSTSDGNQDTGRAVIGHGDSGGPLLVGDTIGGVAVLTLTTPEEVKSYVNGATGIGFHASLNSKFALELMKQAEEAGAKINRVQNPEDAKIYFAVGLDPNTPFQQSEALKNVSGYVGVDAGGC